MSLITPSVGNASGVAAQVPIEQQLDELSNRHRVALSQARVLDEVAKLAQASAPSTSSVMVLPVSVLMKICMFLFVLCRRRLYIPAS